MKKGMRVIAFALAFILTFTTLISDTSIMSVHAEAATEEQSDEPQVVEESAPEVESVEPSSTDIEKRNQRQAKLLRQRSQQKLRRLQQSLPQ